MNKPDILGVEVLTPDGRGSIISLHNNAVVVRLNIIKFKQVMIGRKRNMGEMQYAYPYEDVTVIKGQYCFNEDRLKFQYGETPT